MSISFSKRTVIHGVNRSVGRSVGLVWSGLDWTGLDCNTRSERVGLVWSGLVGRSVGYDQFERMWNK